MCGRRGGARITGQRVPQVRTAGRYRHVLTVLHCTDSAAMYTHTHACMHTHTHKHMHTHTHTLSLSHTHTLPLLCSPPLAAAC